MRLFWVPESGASPICSRSTGNARAISAWLGNGGANWFRLSGRGQASLEVICIAIVMVGLLFLVLVTTYSKNAQTGEMLSMSENGIECNEIGGVIARLNNNMAGVSETLVLAADAVFLRVGGKPGGILVGNAGCYYVGSVGYGTLSDLGGFTLSAGEWCFEKQGNGIAVGEGGCA